MALRGLQELEEGPAGSRLLVGAEGAGSRERVEIALHRDGFWGQKKGRHFWRPRINHWRVEGDYFAAAAAYRFAKSKVWHMRFTTLSPLP